MILPGMQSIANANDITFAVIGPHEYDLPVNFKPFNVFVQYGEFNSTSQMFNSSGHVVHAPQQDLVEGLSKYVYFWTFAEIPNIGFAYEIIVPEVRIATKGSPDAAGVADPLTGPAVWFKPTANSTIGFQTFFQVPIGMSEVTNHYMDNNSSIFYDYQGDNFDITGNTGGVFRTDRHGGGLTPLREGTTFFSDLRVGYKNTSPIEPFAAADFAVTTGSKDLNTGLIVPASNNRDFALGAGAVMTFTPAANLTLRYSRSVAGANTYLTNAAYLKFVYLF